MKIRFSGVPQIQSALNGWMTRITMIKRKETVVDGIVIPQDMVLHFYGMVQPLDPRSLQLKPEGQRSFTWLQIHCKLRALTLIPGDKIKYNGQLYKVMERFDRQQNGYLEFHAIQDTQGGSQ